MECQRHLFQLPEDVHYINCAYMSPLLRNAEERGIEGIRRKRDPSQIQAHDFFDNVEIVKQHFADLIHSDVESIAIIPSASYGLMSAVQNVPFKNGQHALTISDEFPSGQFALHRWCTQHGAELKIISPTTKNNIYVNWNRNILEAINEQTALVLMSSVHWMDGTLFQLEQIGQRCEEVGATFIVDGSQSVGALPIDVRLSHIDALICATYKWLLGPYSIGIGYYGNKFHSGVPIEESWMNRTNAQQFSNLTDYDFEYKKGAQRYSVGEASHFIHMPMLEAGLQQLLTWGPSHIQSYCKSLTHELVGSLREMEIEIEDDHHRAFHLFGIKLPDNINSEKLVQKFRNENLFLSVRGNSIRISPHVYNTEKDIEVLSEILLSSIKELRT